MTRKKYNPYITSIQNIDTDSDTSDTDQETSSDESDNVMVSDDTDQEI